MLPHSNNAELSKLPYSKDEVTFLQTQLRTFGKLAVMPAPDESDETTMWNDNWESSTLPKLIIIAEKLLEYAATCYQNKRTQSTNDNLALNKQAKTNSNTVDAENEENDSNIITTNQSKSSETKDYESNAQQSKGRNTPLMPTIIGGTSYNNTNNTITANSNNTNNNMRTTSNIEVDPEEVEMNTSTLRPFTYEEFVEENSYLLAEMEELVMTPFTVHRLLELLLNPFAHYTDANGEIRGEALQAALRRCILVSSPAMRTLMML